MFPIHCPDNSDMLSGCFRNQCPDVTEIRKNLKTTQIQNMLDDIFDEGEVSTSLIIKIYNVLSGSLDKAVRMGMIVKNPAKEVSLPKENKKEIRVFTLEEQKAFIKALDKEDTRALFLTYLYTGARLGELPSLTWNDIDLDTGIIDINKKAIVIQDYSSKEKKTRQVVQNFCKTKSSIRKIFITPQLIKVLMELKQQQIKQFESCGKEWKSSELVFPTIHGTIPYTRNIQEKFDRIVKALGIKGATMHSLRHTYATRLFEAEVDIKIVSQQLGHKNVKITYDTYVHVMPEKKKRELDKLNVIDALIA